MRNVIYILATLFLAVAFTACSKDSDYNGEGLTTKKSDPTPDPTVEKQWAFADGGSLFINKERMAYSELHWACTNGERDTSYMEPWFLDINTTDLVVYRNTYEPSRQKGRTPDAERSVENEVKDKYGNLVKRHHYTQPYEFNNFTHRISGAWTTGRILYNNGKEEAYLPKDGLYYDMSYSVGDTVHFVRNDSIFAREDVKITYKATLKKDPNVPRSWETFEEKATVTVISFIGIVQKIPGADYYIPNLEWHAERANRFWNGSQWCDGLLLSSATHWYMLVTTFQLYDNNTKERPLNTTLISRPKSDFKGTYNGIMYVEERGEITPAFINVLGETWTLGVNYADGSYANKVEKKTDTVISGVKNISEDGTSTTTPWIKSTWTETKYSGVNYYTVTLKTTAHAMQISIADASLK